jgi:hypothetical protein
MTFSEAVLDAARTVQILQAHGARAGDIGRDLGCAPSWVPIEMHIRERNRSEHLFRALLTPGQLLAFSRARGWS